MTSSSTPQSDALQAVDLSTLPRVEVGPGCYRWDLPGDDSVRAWVVEIAAGAQWPYIDTHDEMGEAVFVTAGELIEGENRYGPGAYIRFGPFSSHQPRSETGVKLFGFNLAARPR